MGAVGLSDDLVPLPEGGVPVLAMSQLKCTVTAIRPEGATFFSPFLPPVVGDTTTLNLDVESIGGIQFDSGNSIGTNNSLQHPLMRDKNILLEGNVRAFRGRIPSSFLSLHYDGNLVAYVEENIVKVGLDIVVTPHSAARVQMQSLDMDCKQ